MADDPAYIKNLKKLTRSDPTLQDLDKLSKEIYENPSDRAVVIMLGSFVEANLERLFLSMMRNDLNSLQRKQIFEFEGAIGSFSSKIVMAYALKLIGPTARHDLDLVRVLRNEFAHSRISFGFGSSEILDFCKELKLIDTTSPFPYGYMGKDTNGKMIHFSDINDAKTRFISTCLNLVSRIRMKAFGPRPGDFAIPESQLLP